MPSLVFAKPARIAIVIDDIGYRQTDGDVLQLPGALTLSVLPHTPFGKALATEAHEQDKDVLLHIPMEPSAKVNDRLLGPGALMADMTEQMIRRSLTASFDEIPFAVGINNHMGSKLTELYQPMAWTMRYLKERNVMFLDSLTSRQSKGRRVADHFDVPMLSRSIFLDNQLDYPYINQQFDKLIRIAKRHERAVAIAHPHPQTIAALRQLLPKLQQENIELVPISQLITTSHHLPSQLARIGGE